MIVAGINADAILVMDFLLEYNCKVDLASQHLVIDKMPVMICKRVFHQPVGES